jgi:chromosome partitioning protein
MVLQSMIPTKEKGFVIVLGNEKGGTGKSTVSMHLITHLLRLGFSVGSIDIDARQGTLTRYIENRLNYRDTHGIDLLVPDHHPLFKSTLETKEMAEAEDREKFLALMAKLSAMDFILIDTPGTDSYLSRFAHSYADLLITPLNDSFIDLDMIGRIDAETGEVKRPSTYAEMVWEQKKARAMRRENTFEWLVMRNRLSSIFAKNKEDMQAALEALAKRLGFRVAEGFGERVIFRELFLKGLTVLDLQDAKIDMSLSHLAARQELRNLLNMIELPQVTQKLAVAS